MAGRHRVTERAAAAAAVLAGLFGTAPGAALAQDAAPAATPAVAAAPAPAAHADDIAAGRAVAALAAKRDAKTLASRLSPLALAALPEDALQKLLDRTFTERTPLGPPLTESIRQEGAGYRAYVAEYGWRADRPLRIVAVFAAGGTEKITGLRLEPGLLAQAAALKAGRDIDDLVKEKDLPILEARFTPELAKVFPDADVRKTFATLFPPKTPLGPLADDKIEDAGDGWLQYTALHPWKVSAKEVQPLTVIVRFEAGGAHRLGGLRFVPGKPVPVKAAPKPSPKPAAKPKEPRK